MNTNRETNRSETVLRDETISHETLDHVVGGLNPQPLPPGEVKLDKASPKFSWGVS
jgi:hypothetical protein